MAQIIWTEPALTDLDAIADYIALENPRAASQLVTRVFRRAMLIHPARHAQRAALAQAATSGA